MKALLASVCVILSGASFLWFATDGMSALTAEAARRIDVAENKPTMPNVLLETMSGTKEPLHKDGEVVIAEFIYTTCPFICQTGGSYLERLQNEVVAEGLSHDVRIVSISFDPENDNPVELSYYADRHKADGEVWKIARPSKEDLPNLLRSFGVVVIPDEFGGFQHNIAMHVMDRDGRLAAIVDSDDVAGALGKIKEVLQ